MMRTRLVPAALTVLAFAAFPAVTCGDETGHSIDVAIGKIGKDARVSVLARSVTTGETLYERDADEPEVPASTMKIATTATALELLGPGFEHETRVLAAGSLGKDGVLKGNLVIRGSGDPSISRRFQLDDARPLLSDWADDIKKTVKVIEGDLVADDRAFERLGFHPDWDPKEAQEWYAAEVSALNLNDNCVDIEVTPGPNGVQVVARPQTSAFVLDVRATLTPAKGEHKLSYVRDQDGRTFHVTGKVWTKAPAFESPVAVTQPALVFASVLADRLKEAGVTLNGKVRLLDTTEQRPEGPNVLVRRSPLPRALMVCNKRSQNLYAECLLKTLGLAKGQGGSWVEGAKVVEKHLASLKIPADQFCVRDGSGLSREDRLSARALETVLECMAKGPNASMFMDSLSTAGVDGTLEKRLKTLARGAVFHGKTGTMHGVSALAGLLELEHGAHGEHEVIAIAFIVNGTHGAATARQAQDDAVRVIASQRCTSAVKTNGTDRP